MDILQRYETELDRDVAGIVLLGQLPYDESHLIELADAFRPIFSQSITRGLGWAREHYPLTFALYLVLEGLYHYNGGDYWTGPREALGITGNYTADAGDIFRTALHGASLRTFEDLGGHIHVTPILAHGGIPNYCLDDFFDLLERTVRSETAVDVPTLMDEWATIGFPPNIDRPVQRFLLHGGDTAEEFVGRCLELWGEDGIDPESLDLPQRVLDGYELWRERQGARGRGRSHVRLTRPKLVLDPYGEGPAIVLPPVTYAEDHAPATVTWKIKTGDRQRVETTYRRQLNGETEFVARAAAVNVLTVAPSYSVTVLADDAAIRSWTLDGPAELPVLAFDPDTGELLLDRQRDNVKEYWISPGERWLVFPRDWTAGPEKSRKLVELPDLDGEWARFVFETWELEPDGRLDLTAPDGRTVAFRARNDLPPARPVLEGETPIIAAGIHERFSLYGGRPPDLCIPPDRAGHKPNRWRIEITPIGTTDPPTPRAFPLDKLQHRYIILEENLILPLDAPELLGQSPFGEFHVRLRGPYGRKADFDLRFAPGLAFMDYPRLDLRGGDAPTEIGIVHLAHLDLTSGKTGVTVGPRRPGRQGVAARIVSVMPDLARAPLVLRGDDGELAFDLPAYRLRYGLLEPERPDAFRWATTPRRLHPEALEDLHTALLRVDLPLPPGTPPLAVGWRLVDTDGGVLRELEPDFARRSSRHPQTSLAEWMDTFLHAGRVAALHLVLVNGETREETTIEIARLLPTLELGEVVTAWGVDPGGDRLSVIWETDSPARNRRLRLWPVDKPWVSAPVVLAIPDDANACAVWDLPPFRLPPGDYLAEMVVEDPWDISSPVRPAPGLPNTFILQPDDPDAALKDALSRARRDELAAEDALAWILYLARTRAGSAVACFNVTLLKASLSMEQLIFWADAVRSIGDEKAYQLVQKALFNSDRTAELGTLDEELRAAYLAHLPHGLDPEIYREILPIAAIDARRLCLEELCRAGDEVAFRTLVSDVACTEITTDEAVAMLLPSAPQALAFLSAESDPAVTILMIALLRQAPDDRFIVAGNDLQTNAGHFRVTAIRQEPKKELLEICPTVGGPHTLIGKMWPGESELLVQINLQSRTIETLKGPVYRCQFSGQPPCDHFFANLNEIKKHYRAVHRMDYSSTPKVGKVKLPLTQLKILPRA